MKDGQLKLPAGDAAPLLGEATQAMRTKKRSPGEEGVTA